MGDACAHVNSAGAVVKLELADDEGDLLQVDVTRQRHEEMQPQRGERLYVRPRTMRVFVQPDAARAGPCRCRRGTRVTYCWWGTAIP